MPICEHCLIEFPEQEAIYDREKVFCCNGCLGIYHLILGEGLDAFYGRRKWNEAGKPAFAVSGFKAFPGKGVEGVADGKKVVIGNLALMEENAAGPVPEDILGAVNGFENEGDTVVYAAWDGMVKAIFFVSDVIRPEAARRPGDQKDGPATGILSGDNHLAAKAIALQAGVDTVISEATPVKKSEYIAGLRSEGLKVMMIGDGINDAPALTEASVGIAMGRGTDIAMESADAVLVRNDLMLVLYFIALSRRTFRVIKLNIFWAFFYNVIAIPLAVAGLLHPIIAAGAMASSSLFVVGNSLRIRKF